MEPTNNEYQIPNNIEHDGPVADELAFVYETFETKDENSLSPEKDIAPESQLAYSVQHGVEAARRTKLEREFLIEQDRSQNPFTNTIKRLIGVESTPSMQDLTPDVLIERESRIGGMIFGDVRPGTERKFFYHDNGDWFFYQSGTDAQGRKQESTIRYQVHAPGIVKSIDGVGHVFIQGQELANFTTAIEIYQTRVSAEIYRDNQSTYALAA